MTLLCACFVAVGATAGGVVDALLATDPVVVAERAFAGGDRRYIVVPVCGDQPGEVLPGWPPQKSPEFQQAIETGRRPVTCADLGDASEPKQFIRVANYAARYNRKLLELNDRPSQ